jgi:hypothetical protein
VSEPKGRRNEQMTHPDPEILAEFRAGLITGRPGARISAHLASCDHCAGLCGELAEISALLAAVPPAAMPDRVAQRLDGVLAAETARRDNPQRAGADRPAAPVTSPPSRRRWNFRLVALRVLAPAAAVAVLAAGGYGLSRIGGSSAGSAAAGTAATATAQPRPGALATTGPENRPNAIPALEAPASLQVVSSRTDYRRATLQQQVEHEVQLNARGAAGPREPATESVKGCVHRVTEDVSPGTLVLAEMAYFQGQRAILVVAVSGDRDAAWITGAGCSASGGDVLDETTLPGTSAP